MSAPRPEKGLRARKGPGPLLEGRDTFRELEASRDRPVIEGLLQRAVPHDYLLPILDRWLRARGVLGAFDGKELVALLRLDDLEEGEGWIGAIRVAPERRREGWGRRLTHWGLEVARELGMSSVRLIIEDENTASRALARRLGFRSVAAMSHVVGRTTGGQIGAPRAMRPPTEPEVPEPGSLEGVRALGGYLLTTVPRPMRFVRATRERLLREAKEGTLGVVGKDPREGLCLLGPPATSGRTSESQLRLLAPLGTAAVEIFETACEKTAQDGSLLEGFLPVAGPWLGALQERGWVSGEQAFWGERIQLYEVEL